MSCDFSVIDNHWITLADGTRLAARIWMPKGAEADPVPAVLEFLPYRKQTGTEARDDSTYPVFAAAGIAGIRVDIRGSGESDGVIDGEYSPLELANAAEIIGWIAQQPWSNGSVGMMGISWGGFNCLQVAALRPPALKAVISIASTVDRYNDDIHYKDGCHLSAQLSWAATMLAYQSRCPDPELVGANWREMWLERLRDEPYFMEEWLAHQCRDAFWKHGSICEDFDAVEIPSLVIAGWADGYRNTPLKAVAGMGAKSKAIIGPWVHKYPHFAWPKPRADFHAEAIRWWNRWLRNEENGAEDLPQVRAYILDAIRPALRREHDAGRWIAKERWSEPELLTLYGPQLTQAPQPSGAQSGKTVFLRSPLDSGTAAGEWFTLKPDAELPQDQRGDDAGALVMQTAPLSQPIDLLGRAKVTLRLSCEADWANIVARLVDIHPDGTATRICYGVLNLAHRESNESPSAMPQGKMVEVTLTLDACGYHLRPGHCLRLALGTSYWPTILPPPSDPGVNIDLDSVKLDLPLLGQCAEVQLPEPENPDPLPKYLEHSKGDTSRRVIRDLGTGRTEYHIHDDSGLTEVPGIGMIHGEVRDEVWSITLGDPLSMRGHCRWTIQMQRGDWAVRTLSEAWMECSATDWILRAKVTAWEGDEIVSERSFERTIPRNFM
ncbi:CocE/NonD family hydrolase [Paracoccus sp. (in: a-proteobacteria)]|uniref:CocE/NonD family hydrolase n=1 Tax=Paracoccus sp. TaxID=267 RepID=UPI00289BDBD7|nr:CocE/NonD family hydrolase [Paracoccus sp. (in: a-proteobacteria)]